jgi:hypothetical protein
MKDSYVGDIGDFANNGLLRHIFGGPGAPTVQNPLRLGVVWYLNKVTSTTDYLSKGVGLEECDSELYGTLNGLVSKSYPTIATVKKSGILPCNTLFYDVPLPRASRRNADDKWMEGALKKTEGADVVFINPDKGISQDAKHAGPEHVSIAELKRFYQEGEKSLIVYQHRYRLLNKADETELIINKWAETFHNELNPSPYLRVLRWNRNPVRFYFLILQRRHTWCLAQRIEALKGSKWGKKLPGLDTPHFTVER